MAQVSKIIGMRAILRKFEKLERESRRQDTGNVNVGFGANYALHVHEINRPHFNPPDAQWKFLEQPFREMRKETRNTIVAAVRGGASLIKALLIAGLNIQRASQLLAPVDTGNLKGSAFTERE